MKAYRGSRDIAPFILALGLDGEEWLASIPGRFIPGEWSPGTYWIGGFVGTTAGLDLVGKKIIFASAENRTPERPSRSLALKCYRVTF